LIDINLPTDFNTNLLMLFRYLHFVGGVTWLGLLYFFNLVNTPFMKGLDPATRGKILPSLMSRSLWWFRWGSVLTVLTGLAYWGSVVASDARSGGASSGGPMGTFFAIWTVAWALMYACQIPGKGALDKGPVLALIYTVIVVAASCLFLRLNDHGWESNRLLAIGVGGGMGWVGALYIALHAVIFVFTCILLWRLLSRSRHIGVSILLQGALYLYVLAALAISLYLIL